MIYRESEVARIRSLLRERTNQTREPTTITEAIRFTLQHAEALAFAPMSHVTAGEEPCAEADCTA